MEVMVTECILCGQYVIHIEDGVCYECASKQKVKKVIVAGGREFNNYELLKSRLDHYLSRFITDGYSIEIVSGVATGADSLGETYATEKGYPIVRFHANWNKYGKPAGPIRNAEMGDYADACVCFWNGVSTGTKSMIDIAKDKGLLLKVVYY